MSRGQGLGRESALRLAKAGATVVLTTRSAVKGQKAVEEVKLGLEVKGTTMTSCRDYRDFARDFSLKKIWVNLEILKFKHGK